MAVVFPTRGDEALLLAFMSSLELFKGDVSKDEENADERVFGFSKEAIDNVESCCDTLLEHLESISKFFTGGGPLTGRNVLLDKTALTSGSVMPHARKYEPGSMPPTILSDVSAADVFGIANPADFFAAQQDELALVKAQVESAQETLRSVNRAHGFIWTGDTALVKKFLGSQGDQTLSLLYQMNSARTKMKAAPNQSDNVQQTRDAARGREEGMQEAEAMRRLLSLPQQSLPGPAVKDAYTRFIQASTQLLRWLTTVLQMVKGEDDVPRSGTYSVPVGKAKTTGSNEAAAGETEGAGDGSAVETSMNSALPETVVQAARTRTVRVRRFEIHDAHYMYDSFVEQTKCFFLPEYTQYDARIQRRLLQPAYFNSLRDLLADMSREVNRLSDIAARKEAGPVHLNPALSPYYPYGSHSAQTARAAAPGEELPEIVFRPPLSSFRFLRDSLHIYLSTCINEDDTSSLLYHEHVYDDALAQARDAARTIRRLPKPPKQNEGLAGSPEAQGANSARVQSYPGHLEQQEGLSPRDNGFAFLQVDHAEDTDSVATAGRRLSGWPPTQEERGILVSGFEAYWEVRARIAALRTSLAKDIKQKNRTHVTRVGSWAVSSEKSHVQRKAEAQQRQFPERGVGITSSLSFWDAVRSSLQSLGNAVTCKAELNPGDVSHTAGGGQESGSRDDEGFPLTRTSPFHVEKQRLLGHVERLWSVMEAQGVQLEVTYAGLFFRGEREKWADRVGRLVKKAEGVSVVFSA